MHLNTPSTSHKMHFNTPSSQNYFIKVTLMLNAKEILIKCMLNDAFKHRECVNAEL